MKNKSAIRFGTYLGASLIAFSLLMYVIGATQESTINSLGNIALFSVFIFFSIQECRDVELGGYISFKRALTQGVKASSFAAILFAAYYFVYLEFIDSDIMQQMEEQIILGYENSGMEEEQIDEMMDAYNQMISPGLLAAGSVAGNVIFGGIISLVLAYFLKKNNPNPFEA